jgi:predicted metal-dependent hydrolase
MQFELNLPSVPGANGKSECWLRVGTGLMKLQLVRNHRARRYVLRVNRDGTARVAVPRRGSFQEALRFAERNVPWLEKQRLREFQRPTVPHAWKVGTHILVRGDSLPLQAGVDGDHVVVFGDHRLRVRDRQADLRREIEGYLRALAVRELPARTLELAAQHGIPLQRISIRNQRSRWGSCSRKGTISLNWRLIQTPPFVTDYILLHELAHVKEMNHSARFWKEVARLCPPYLEAEKWLKRNSKLLL